MAMPRKPKAIKLNLSEHTLDINVRKCNYDLFDFREVDEGAFGTFLTKRTKCFGLASGIWQPQRWSLPAVERFRLG